MKNKCNWYVDADILSMRIAEELPDKRGEAYYALSMVLEMIESERKQVEESKDGKESGSVTVHSTEKKIEPHFNITIEAFGVGDLRNQIGDLYAYTYSEGFIESLESYSAFEYDSGTGITKIDIGDIK